MVFILIMRPLSARRIVGNPPEGRHPEELSIELYIVLIREELLYCAIVGSISTIGLIYKCNIWFYTDYEVIIGKANVLNFLKGVERLSATNELNRGRQQCFSRSNQQVLLFNLDPLQADNDPISRCKGQPSCSSFQNE